MILKKYKIEFLDKIAALSAIIMFICSYLYMYIALPLNPDTTGTYIVGISNESSISFQLNMSSGRWFRAIIEVLLQKIQYETIIPFFIFIFLVIIAGIFAIFLRRYFCFQNIISCIFISATVLVAPAYVELFSFYHDAFFHGVAIIMLMISLHNIKENKYFQTILFLSFAVGIYQGYIFVFASIYLIKLLQDSIFERKNSKNITLDIIKMVVVLCISVIIYYVIHKLFCIALSYNIKANEGRFNMHGIDIITILGSIIKAYGMIAILPVKNYAGINTTIVAKVILIILYIYCIIKFIFIEKTSKNRILNLSILLLLPLFMNGIAFIPSNTTIRMTQGLDTILILIAVIFDYNLQSSISNEKIRKFIMNSTKVVALCFVVLMIHMCYYANGTAYISKLVSDGTKSYVQEMVTQIKNIEGYNKNTKVLFYGNIIRNNLFDYYAYTNDERFPLAMYENSLLSPWEYKEAINRYGAFKYKEASKEEIEKIVVTNEFKNMGIYPEKNGIKMINDIVVVKFSE